MANSFFDKLKKGMGIEGGQQKKIEEEIKPKTVQLKKKKTGPKIEPEMIIKPEAIKPEMIKPKKMGNLENLGGGEGKLAVDVYQTENDLVIQSAVAGVKTEDLEINFERDIVTVRGIRKKPVEEEGDYLTQECYWGQFSREIILPVEVDPERLEASMKEGVLTIRMPKILREKKRTIKVKF